MNRQLMLLSSAERKKIKAQKNLERDKEIVKRFEELCGKHGASDATIIIANEYAVSIPTVYNIRNRVKNGK